MVHEEIAEEFLSAPEGVTETRHFEGRYLEKMRRA